MKQSVGRIFGKSGGMILGKSRYGNFIFPFSVFSL